MSSLSFSSSSDLQSDTPFENLNYLYQLRNRVEKSRQLMFEIVEIPHLCQGLDHSYFSKDMASIKRAHHYMKKQITNQYHDSIKVKLKEQLQNILSELKHLTKFVEEHYEFLKDKIDSSYLVKPLIDFFSNPNKKSKRNHEESGGPNSQVDEEDPFSNF